jgi:hypothetical protein
MHGDARGAGAGRRTNRPRKLRFRGSERSERSCVRTRTRAAQPTPMERCLRGAHQDLARTLGSARCLPGGYRAVLHDVARSHLAFPYISELK